MAISVLPKGSGEQPISQDATLENESKHEKDGEQGDNSIDPRNEIKGLRLLALHLGLCISTFLVGLDFTLVATAVPVITSHFDSVQDVGWYGGAFYLSLCAATPLAGRVFTQFPKRAAYALYVGVFEVGSLVSALAPSSRALIVGRAVAGLGASGIFAGGLVILTTVIPLHRRAVWQGTFSSTFSIASVVGPVVGGALAQHVSWRWCFYLNLPIGAAAAAVVLLTLRVHPAEAEGQSLKSRARSLDFGGFALFAGAVIMLLLALQWGGVQYAWDSSVTIGLFVGAGVTLLLFIALQIRLADRALIPPRVFLNRNFALIFLSALFSSGSFQTVVYWLPIWFQGVRDVSPTGSGVRYLPTVISDVVATFIGPGIVQVMGYWTPLLLLGCALLSIGCGLLTTLYPAISEGHWIGYQIICGVGYALIVTLSHLGVQASLPPELVGIGATTLLFCMSASSAIWLSVGQTIFQHQLKSALASVLPDTNSVHEIILSIGVTRLSSVVSPQDLPAVVKAYSLAVTKVFFIPAAAPALAFLLIAGTRWTSVKKSQEQPKKKGNNGVSET